MLPIHRQPAGFFARSNLPATFDRQLIGIELNYLAGIFNVYEDVTLFIGDREFGFSSEGSRAGYSSSLSVDGRGILAGAIKCKDSL